MKNDDAKKAILAGRDLMLHMTNTSDCDKAIGLFKKALLIVPNSSLAHSYLAMAATARTHYNADRSFLERGKTEAGHSISSSLPNQAMHIEHWPVCNIKREDFQKRSRKGCKQ